ncbi:tripartite motif-containing protein 16-like [Cololabis saira]|uniref:tripartite motif-containing protein 16-like n=1 Tax=Cololabis saira TaxID=129043 RepID=UPI002AD47A50|nr:tripartite motif-containing protein 16-like [Cololabis saira]
MAEKGAQPDQETLTCSICLDLLKDPVAIPCGHSYCMKCIGNFWDEKEHKKTHSCPDCRQTFTPKPLLVKNVMLAVLVEQLRTTGLQAAPADCSYAGPEDVACDVCTGRKLKAMKSCLVCLVSYCEKHLQQHYSVAQLKKHQLVEPTKTLQENLCSLHDEVMKMFCRTDQQSVCYVCTVDEHKGHDVVSAKTERAEKQREMGMTRQKIQTKVQDLEEEVKLLQREVGNINRSADKTVEDSEKIFRELVLLIQKRSSDVKQKVRSQQETEVSRVKEVQEKLQQEITDLKKKDTDMEQLSRTQDHNQFLHGYTSLLPLSESTHSSGINRRPLKYFEDVQAAVSETREELQDILGKKWTDISLRVTEADVLLSQPPEPRTRADFLRYSREITLDRNTAHNQLELSEGNRKATIMRGSQGYPRHPERSSVPFQILSEESLTGRCYWEVEWGGEEGSVAVTYKDVNTPDTKFGLNNTSWALVCKNKSNEFWHNKLKTAVSDSQSSRVGVYLDHRAGILSFYSVSETMTLLHRVQTTFTKPLHVGIRLWFPIGNTARFYKPT